MEINRQDNHTFTIKSYDEQSITVAETQYTHSIFISNQKIQTDWPVNSITDLTENNIQPLLNFNPEIIIIGHTDINLQLPISTRIFLAQQRIGIENMNIGSACRTFNILLSEGRKVVFGYIPSTNKF